MKSKKLEWLNQTVKKVFNTSKIRCCIHWRWTFTKFFKYLLKLRNLVVSSDLTFSYFKKYFPDIQYESLFSCTYVTDYCAINAIINSESVVSCFKCHIIWCCNGSNLLSCCISPFSVPERCGCNKIASVYLSSYQCSVSVPMWGWLQIHIPTLMIIDWVVII